MLDQKDRDDCRYHLNLLAKKYLPEYRSLKRLNIIIAIRPKEPAIKNKKPETMFSAHMPVTCF